MPRNIIIGQKVISDKVERAREMRRHPTAAEATLWEALRANRLEGWHFRRQQVIQGFVVDFYCHRGSLVVEVDGPIHAQQAAADQEREQALEEIGLRVMRFSNSQVLEELPAVLHAIRDALRATSRPVK